MAKLFTPLLLLFLLGYTMPTKAQYMEPTQSIYLELGGAGLIYSFNYDFRFDKGNLESWGMRIGAGGFARGLQSEESSSYGFVTVPMQLNKLFGKNEHYFEFGGGATFIYSRYYYRDLHNPTTINKELEFFLNTGNTPSFMGTLSFGYRKIPQNGGFTYRANLSPMFNNDGFLPLFFGIGGGYAFY